MPIAGRLLVAFARLHHSAGRALAISHAFVDGVATEALDEHEQTVVGVALYDAGRHNRRTDLHPWEARWFDQRLSGRPGRVLVGGCGAGRELRALMDRGWQAVGFDPAPSMVADARRAAPGAECFVASWQDVAAHVLDGAPAPDGTALAAGGFDAVLFGQGCLTHLLSDDSARRSLAAADALAPAGPLLVSYWRARPGVRPDERAREAGRGIGRRLGALRGVATPAPDVSMHTAIGFARSYHDAELTRMATDLGRDWFRDDVDGEYPHATLAPRST